MALNEESVKKILRSVLISAGKHGILLTKIQGKRCLDHFWYHFLNATFWVPLFECHFLMPLCGATVDVILEGEFKEMSGAYIDYQHLGFRKLEEFFRQGIPDVVKLEVTSTGDTVS